MTTGIRPLCVYCARRIASDTQLICEAYPSGIPEAIYMNEVDHRYPVMGDNGIQFEARPDADLQGLNRLLGDLSEVIRVRQG